MDDLVSTYSIHTKSVDTKSYADKLPIYLHHNISLSLSLSYCLFHKHARTQARSRALLQTLIKISSSKRKLKEKFCTTAMLLF